MIWPLLDAHRGGALRIGPAGAAKASCSYLEGTAVLRYEWETGTGRAAARVAMALPNRGGQDLVWVLDGLAGEVELEVVFDPRPGFGRRKADLERMGPGLQEMTSEGMRLAFVGPPELGRVMPGRARMLRIAAGDQGAFRLHADRSVSAGLARPRLGHGVQGG